MEDVAHQLASVDLAHRGAPVALQDDAELIAELLFLLLWVAQSQVTQTARQAVQVLVDRVHEDVDGRLAVTRRKLADHPEVDQADVVRGTDDDVRRVGVRVEEAVDEHHFHPGLGDPRGQRTPVVGRPALQVRVRQGVAVEPFQHEHATRRRSPEHLGNGDGGVSGECATGGLDVSRLDAVVEFLPNGAAELVDKGDHVDELQALDPLLDHLGQLLQERQVGLERCLRVRALHLDGDLATPGEARTMDLPDRCGGHRLVIERREGLVDRQPELAFDHRTCDARGHWCGGVLQGTKLADDVGWDDVRACRQELAELDERGAEFVEHLAKSLATRSAMPAVICRSSLVEKEAEAMTGGDLTDLADARNVLPSLCLGHRTRLARSPDGAAIGS